MTDFLLFLSTAIPPGLATAAAMIGLHYATWHRRALLTRFPPLSHALGTGLLFIGYGAWGATLTALVPALWVVAGCFVITALAGAGNVAIWRWHPHQTAVETADAVTGLRAVLDKRPPG